MNFPVFLRSRPVYMIAIFLIPVASFFGNYFASTEPIFRGQNLAIILSYSLAALAIFLWIPYVSSDTWSSKQQMFLGLVIISWLIETISTQMDHSVFNINAFLFVPMVLLILIKRPTLWGMTIAFLVFMYAIVVMTVISLVFGSLGITPDGFQVGDSGPNRVFLLTDIFGITTRWGGPFYSVNEAAPIGGLLLIFGLTLKKPHAIVMVSTGILILLLAQARTSLVAVVVGLLVLIMFSDRVRQEHFHKLIQSALIAIAIFGVGLYIFLVDPTLNGRVPVWLDFVRFFASSPISGVGTSGILEAAVEKGSVINGPIAHTKAHSVLLDIAARHGLVLLIPRLLVFAISLLLIWPTRFYDRGKSLAPLAYIFFAGVSETIHSWQYFSVYTVALIYLVGQVQDQRSMRLPS